MNRSYYQIKQKYTFNELSSSCMQHATCNLAHIPNTNIPFYLWLTNIIITTTHTFAKCFEKCTLNIQNDEMFDNHNSQKNTLSLLRLFHGVNRHRQTRNMQKNRFSNFLLLFLVCSPTITNEYFYVNFRIV